MIQRLVFALPFIGIILEILFKTISHAYGDTGLVIFMSTWMVSWWIFSIAPLGATALIPLVFLPSFDILSLKIITPYYSDSMIFLFLGGFILARGLEKTELSERFALNVLKFTGRSDTGIVVGFTIATALLSMWISNTATAIMMIPIAQSVLKFLDKNTEHREIDIKNFSTVIYLSIAYSANIGGTMTPIGTPPNVVFLGFLENIYHIQIDFWKWGMIMIPTSIVFLIFQIILLKKLFKYKIPITSNFREFVIKQVKALAPFNKAQKLTLSIFFLSCFLWIFKDLINNLSGLKVLTDTTIAILAGSLLFFVPYDFKKFSRILDEDDISTLPWNIILLFGGGMAMAGSLEKFNVIESMVKFFEHLPLNSPFLLVFLVAALTLILTELMSNVALCMVAMPLIMSLGASKGINPIIIGLPAAICASYAFTLPISTPPNAIVFGTNKVAMKDMLRAGILMNIFGVLTVMSMGWLILNFIYN